MDGGPDSAPRSDSQPCTGMRNSFWLSNTCKATTASGNNKKSVWPKEPKGHFLQPGSGCPTCFAPLRQRPNVVTTWTIASLTALVLGGLWAWWTVHKARIACNTPAPPPSQLARLEQRFLHVRDATMRLNETALQREKLHEQQQSLAQLNRIKEGVQLLLDALERNMVRHQNAPQKKLGRWSVNCPTPARPCATSWTWKGILNSRQRLGSQAESHRRNPVKYTDINPTQPFDIEADAMTNLDRLFQEKTSAQEA